MRVISLIILFINICEAKTIAVLDSGLSIKNPSFSKYLSYFDNQNLKGFDFVKSSREIEDTHGHGNHITSLIVLGNKDPIKIIPLRFTDGIIKETPEDIIKEEFKFLRALETAIFMNANIINISFTRKKYSKEEYNLFKMALDKKIIVVVSAGNDSEVIDDSNKVFPCAYELENIICVGNGKNRKSPNQSSNRGKFVKYFVDGSNKVGLGLNDSLEIKSGSSQSAALVSRKINSLLNKGISYEKILKKFKN